MNNNNPDMEEIDISDLKRKIIDKQWRKKNFGTVDDTVEPKTNEIVRPNFNPFYDPDPNETYPAEPETNPQKPTKKDNGGIGYETTQNFQSKPVKWIFGGEPIIEFIKAYYSLDTKAKPKQITEIWKTNREEIEKKLDQILIEPRYNHNEGNQYIKNNLEGSNWKIYFKGAIRQSPRQRNIIHKIEYISNNNN